MSNQAAKMSNFNIHLIKESITSLNDMIVTKSASGTPLLSTRIPSTNIQGATLVYEEQKEKLVDWVELLRSGFPGIPDLKSKHAAVVVFLEVGTRMFALTYGYGKKLLKDSSCVTDFGLRTALCICDEDTLKAVNFRTIEEKTRIGRLQLSDQSTMDSFRLETDTDLLRGIEATSKRTDICERVGAKWENLIISAKAGIADLPKICEDLLNIYENGILPDEFKWVDNVKRVLDKAKITLLNKELCQLLDANELENIRLAVPEISGESTGVSAHLFKSDGVELTSSVKEYLEARPRKVKNTIDAMQKVHSVVLMNNNTGGVFQNISVFRCLVAEVNYSGCIYLLADGEWFVLDQNFVDEVNTFIKQVPTVPHSMPDWKIKENEGKWNKRAEKVWSKTIDMDAKLIYHGGGRNKIEFADLINRLEAVTKLCHVKRIDKHSNGLSHLFGQGAVSAELLSQDDEFRKKVADKLPHINYGLKKDLERKTFTPSEWMIVYVLLGVSNDRDELVKKMPFFSRINLRKHVQRVRAMQYSVALIGIPTE